MPPAEMVESENRDMVGVTVGGWLVMFGRKGEVKGDVSFRAPGGETENLVVDLLRGRKYRVTGIVGGDQEMTVSQEGSLRFVSSGPGMVTLVPLERM